MPATEVMMLGRVLRQNRRFALSTLLLMLWIYSFAALQTEQALWLYSPYGFALVAVGAMLVVAIPLMLIVLAFPPVLPTFEIMLAVMFLMLPVQEMVPDVHLPGWVELLILSIVTLLVAQILYGTWQRRLGVRTMRPRPKTFLTRASPEDVWRALFPDPDHADRYIRGGCTFLPPPEGSVGNFVMTCPRLKGYGNSVRLIWVEEKEPFRRFVYRDTAVTTGRPKRAPDARLAVEIGETRNGRTSVTVEVTFIDVTFGEWLLFTLSNSVADMAACFRDRLDGRRDWSILGWLLPLPGT